ncbi:MAG TPA: hypothetical protein DD727_03550 [Clostridiales bacterium]|nr:hypothetical protein [Clostridiales bacterium]
MGNLSDRLKKIELDDKPLFESYLTRFPPTVSDLVFSNLFMWRHYYRAERIEIAGTLCILCRPRGIRPFAFPPVGPCESERMEEILSTIRQIQHERGITQGVMFRRVPEKVMECFKHIVPEEDLTIQYDRNGSDYVYLREDLVQLKGKRYDGKRNHLNRFNVLYESEFVPFDSASIQNGIQDECMEILEQWARDHQEERDGIFYCENLANKEMVENIPNLGIKGALVRVGGRAEAFTTGEMLGKDTAVIHIEKANPRVRGLYTYINRMFAEQGFPEATYINREEDMGAEGLRKAKTSYCPVHMVDKYDVIIR